MKKQLIEQLVKMSDLELLETLDALFKQCRKPSYHEGDEQTCLIVVEHAGNLNANNGGFQPDSLDEAIYLALPADKSSLKIPTPKFNLSGICSNCGVKIKGCDILVKCPYCYSDVECQ